MFIDDCGMPHDFCTTIRMRRVSLQAPFTDESVIVGNSNIMADKVRGWVDGIIEAHERAIS